MAQRPKLTRVDAQAQRWFAEIEAELVTWPDITTRPMFGLVSYYRSGVIFAAVPRTRAVDTPSSLLLKDPSSPHKRAVGGRGPGGEWSSFELHSEGDIAVALEQLARAYDAADDTLRRRGQS